MFQRKYLGISLEKSDFRFSEGILNMYLDKNLSLLMFLYAALYTMNHAGVLQADL